MSEKVSKREAIRRIYAAINGPTQAGPKWVTYPRKTIDAVLIVIRQLDALNEGSK